MRTFQVGFFARLTDLRWGKGETKNFLFSEARLVTEGGWDADLKDLDGRV